MMSVTGRGNHDLRDAVRVEGGDERDREIRRLRLINRLLRKALTDLVDSMDLHNYMRGIRNQPVLRTAAVLLSRLGGLTKNDR